MKEREGQTEAEVRSKVFRRTCRTSWETSSSSLVGRREGERVKGMKEMKEGLRIRPMRRKMATNVSLWGDRMAELGTKQDNLQSHMTRMFDIVL